MTKFAVLTNIESNFIKYNDIDFDVIDIIKKKIADKITYVNFDGTIDLIKNVETYMGSNNFVHVVNEFYDERTLIQCFYKNVETHEYLIYVKRYINNNNDTYTYFNITEDNELYEYLDITYEDILNIYKKKYINTGVLVSTTDEIKPVEVIFKKDTSDLISLIKIKNDDEDEYTERCIDFDILNKIYDNEYKNKNECNEYENSLRYENFLKTKIVETGASFIQTKHNTTIGIINIYAKINGNEKNNIITKMLSNNNNVYDDVILLLEENEEDNNGRTNKIVQLSVKLFKKYLTIGDNQINRKNTMFFNVYYELFN